MTTWVVKDNILPQVHALINESANQALDGAGQLYKKTARSFCPRSNIEAPGYVHLIDTIDYDTDYESTFFQKWVTFFVVKSYAQFINNGTERMQARPFFTNGVLAVSDGMEGVVRTAFADLIAGRAQVAK